MERKKMKYLVYILVIFFSNLLTSQEQWEIDMLEEESKYHFDSGSQIYDVAQNIIEFDFQLKYLDTTTLKGKIEFELLSTQKGKVLTYALWEFDRILRYYPTSSLINQSIFNKAQIHFDLNQLDSARVYFLKLIHKEIASELDTSRVIDLRDERYFNFKNSAYKRLAELEYQQGNYEKSIGYLSIAEEIGYDHFCGNEHAFNSKHMAMSYAKNYYALDSLDKAIDLLLPHIMRSGFTKNNDAVDLALSYMLQKYEPAYLLTELKNGARNFIKKKPRPNSKSKRYFIHFLNQELQLFMYEEDDLTKEKEMVKQTIENELIYKLLKGEKPSHNRW